MTPHSHRLLTWSLLAALLLTAAPWAAGATAQAQRQPPPGYLPMLLIYGDGFAGGSATFGRQPRMYTVQPGDTLAIIAERFGLATVDLIRANTLADPDTIGVGQELTIPGAAANNSTTPTASTESGATSAGATSAGATDAQRASVEQRRTYSARTAPPGSPFYNTTWLTFYGRPGVPVMGILGEYSIDELVPLLRNQARARTRRKPARCG